MDGGSYGFVKPNAEVRKSFDLTPEKMG